MSTAALLPPDQAAICSLLAPAKPVAHGIVSQAVLTAPGLRVTLFRFAAGQELSEHTTPARALIQVLAGACEFTFPDRGRPVAHAAKAAARGAGAGGSDAAHHPGDTTGGENWRIVKSGVYNL
jgi:hypothetical protein